MRNQKKFNAFTLLEILISIIILGIIAVSFPVIFQTMTNANKQNIKEEFFFEEFTVLSLITQRYFDENNTIGNNFYKDLNATEGADGLKIIKNTFSNGKFSGDYCRIGKCQFNNNILRSGDLNTTSLISLDGSDENFIDTSTLDDIDDFNGYTENFLNKTIHVNVKYIDDNATYSDQNITDFEFNYNSDKNNTNIKLITVWCRVGDTNITIRYPTCNIGASKFLSLEEIGR